MGPRFCISVKLSGETYSPGLGTHTERKKKKTISFFHIALEQRHLGFGSLLGRPQNLFPHIFTAQKGRSTFLSFFGRIKGGPAHGSVL